MKCVIHGCNNSATLKISWWSGTMGKQTGIFCTTCNEELYDKLRSLLILGKSEYLVEAYEG